MPQQKRRSDEMIEGSSRKRQHTDMATGTADNPVTINDAEKTVLISSHDQRFAEGRQDQSQIGSMMALTQLLTDFENLRHTLTCRVCEKLFYEPFVLSCGHTYCYRCLSTWFSSTRKPSCPNCRVKITQLPAPSYVIKDLVAIFVSRTELLPDGETLQDHETWKREEAEFLAQERDNKDPRKGGLFQGKFNGKISRSLRPVVDPSDNVVRCPHCNWELEDGQCGQCGATFDSESHDVLDGESDSSDSEDASHDPYMDAVDDVDGELDLEDDEAVWYDGELSPGSYDGDSGSSSDDDDQSDDSTSSAEIRRGAMARSERRSRRDVLLPRHIRPSTFSDVLGLFPSDGDEADSGNESAGSLVDFVVDDNVRVQTRSRTRRNRRVIDDDDEEDDSEDEGEDEEEEDEAQEEGHDHTITHEYHFSSQSSSSRSSSGSVQDESHSSVADHSQAYSSQDDSEGEEREFEHSYDGEGMIDADASSSEEEEDESDY